MPADHCYRYAGLHLRGGREAGPRLSDANPLQRAPAAASAPSRGGVARLVLSLVLSLVVVQVRRGLATAGQGRLVAGGKTSDKPQGRGARGEGRWVGRPIFASVGLVMLCRLVGV
ncbi:hypothetical protein Sfulv_40760 [Streptomyces fulvorobeus]|uniref:Uncharacterized protein n=1 Tax=Streptomyces fulvorobeus TaxID=284028 RepID=A0A7J0C9Q0_9ACTN|nr:hypothetical protein Sfulv_40760 [Streptomyces fulvorobeus]